MIEKYGLFGMYKYFIPSQSQDWNIKLIYLIKDENLILSVTELLYSNSDNNKNSIMIMIFLPSKIKHICITHPNISYEKN